VNILVMILSSEEIRRRLGSKDHGRGEAGSESGSWKCQLIIHPFDNECLQPASYDLRTAEDVTLLYGNCMLVPSLEWIELPCNIAGTLRCRSSFGRKGVIITGGYVDPGFRGQLTLCLVNMGKEDVPLRKNDRVVQMIFHEVAAGVRSYEGRYQDSLGVVEAR
jgi:dCTP deaminase